MHSKLEVLPDFLEQVQEVVRQKKPQLESERQRLAVKRLASVVAKR